MPAKHFSLFCQILLGIIWYCECLIEYRDSKIPYGDFLALYRLVINLSPSDMLADIFQCLLDLILAKLAYMTKLLASKTY